MNWKQQLEAYENSKDWKAAVDYTSQVLPEHSNEPEVWVRILYLFHHILLEESSERTGLDKDVLKKKFLNYFNDSSKKFSDNAEYLFFVGIIGHIAEWLWGHKENAFAVEMTKKAHELEPLNILYEWGSLNSYRNREECDRKVLLAKKILDNSSEKEWLERRGFPGHYILDIQLKGAAKTICLNEGVQDHKSTIKYREVGKE